MKKVNYKKGLSTLMAATMGLSIFTLIGTSGVDAGRVIRTTSSLYENGKEKGAKKEKPVQQKNNKRKNRQLSVRNKIEMIKNIRMQRSIISNTLERDIAVYNAQVNYIKNNLVIPAFDAFNIEYEETDVINVSEVLVELGFNEVQLHTLINALVEVMKQTRSNHEYLRWVYTSFCSNQLPQGADTIFMNIVGTLRNLCGNDMTKYDQIKDILETIVAYVYDEE